MEYRGYTLKSRPRPTRRGRYAVGVVIARAGTGRPAEREFRADDGIEYILEIEAAKEGFNLGRNLVDRGLVPF